MTKDKIIDIARKSGFNASVGKTDSEGKYRPNVNALSKDVPIEWLERFVQYVEETYIAKIQAEIDHAHINELRLVAPFGKLQGEIAVRASDLEAVISSYRQCEIA